jgi:stearoyl-CoA 9-desaturase NADPH oxidoreductase
MLESYWKQRRLTTIIRLTIVHPVSYGVHMSTETAHPGRVLRALLAVVDSALAPHGLDRYLELLVPAWSSDEVRATVVGVTRPTPSAVTLTLRPNHRWRGHLAGQHTVVTVEVDGVRRARCFSPAGSAHRADGLVELTVKASPHGTVSRHLVDHAERGMVVGLAPAGGEFVLPGRPGARPMSPILLISGGSGVTPVMSMLRTLVDEGHDGPVAFLHYATDPHDHLYRAEVAAIAGSHGAVRTMTAYTRAPGAGDLSGHCSVDHLDAACPRWREAETYVCGPRSLMDAVHGLHRGAGRGDHVHEEAFDLAGVAGRPTGATVTFARSGLAITDDGRPLLQQAECSGLDPQFGCRRGICHTCTRRLVSGAVRDLTTGCVVDEPGAEVRICLHAPAGDVTIDL